MKEKIESAQEIIRTIKNNYMRPIIYSGMGKDSICLIHLCRDMGIKWDIMFHREPYFPIKYRYANRIIEQWGLICRDYPAHKFSIFWQNNTFEVVRHYRTGERDMVFCALLYEPEVFIEGNYLCALRDLYSQPRGDAYYIWDIGLMAHKTVERKPHSDMKPCMLRWPMKHCLNGPDWAYPIWDWTEEDVYQYIIDHGIPINSDVYEVKGGQLVPKKDSTYNPDRRPACYRCMIPDNAMEVMCPKKKCIVNNISSELEKVAMPNDFLVWKETQGYVEVKPEKEE